MTQKIYTGIGSRKTPADECLKMHYLSKKLFRQQYILRSGGARRADLAWERYIPLSHKEIYKPYKGFGGEGGLIAPDLPNWIDAIYIAKQFHPNWRSVERKKEYVQLLGRNVYQVLGEDLNTPTNFILFWAKDIKRDQQGNILDCDGGTGLAVRLAHSLGIKSYHTQEDFDFICKNIIENKENDTIIQKTKTLILI